ncbi:MAG TPA: adenine deaminase C-terminal domain-containing protein [Thermomicrobiales bacterium]|nr:adenine deaminase C-terminal domain-containing protein [Thermomicrobiales bacterium]
MSSPPTPPDAGRAALIEAARGERPLDLVISGGDLLNVYTGEVYPADIGVYSDRVAVVDRERRWGLTGTAEVDARGLTAIPGFVDTHVHIESTMVTPPNFARGVLPFGTTTVVIDPHEIGNVLGRAGVEYMLRASAGLPLRVFVTVPSSVPAVPHLETAGAAFDAVDIAAMLAWPRVVGVAELMDYPGIVRGEARMAAIVAAGLASGKALEGHCPLLADRELAAYLAAGVDSDHECRGWEEMVAKLRAGMWVYGRENTFRHTAAYLARALREVPLPWNAALCTDDIDPADLLAHGHMDRGVRALIAAGLDPALAVRVATLNGATRYGLRDLGGIAPGKLADIVLVDSLADLRARVVLAGGRVVARDGQLTADFADPAPPPLENSVRVGPLAPETFALRRPGAAGDVNLPLLDMDANRQTTLATATLRFTGGAPAGPLPDGLTLLSVVPRHGQAHSPSLALLRGLPLRAGALATTVAHDSHNLIVAGRTPDDMAVAARAVATQGGGAALARDGAVLAAVRLPVAGLLSTEPVAAIAAEVHAFNERAREVGLGGPSPVLAISSLALPVAPFYRLTDLGLVDTLKQEFVAAG